MASKLNNPYQCASCNRDYDMINSIQCGECKGWFHYFCTKLPSYTIVCLKNTKRKYICEICTPKHVDKNWEVLARKAQDAIDYQEYRQQNRKTRMMPVQRNKIDSATHSQIPSTSNSYLSTLVEVPGIVSTSEEINLSTPIQVPKDTDSHSQIPSTSNSYPSIPVEVPGIVSTREEINLCRPTHRQNSSSTPNLTQVEVPEIVSTPENINLSTQYQNLPARPTPNATQIPSTCTPVEVPGIRCTPEDIDISTHIQNSPSTPNTTQIPSTDTPNATPVEVPEIESTPEDINLITNSQNSPGTLNTIQILSTGTPDGTPMEVPDIGSTTPEDKNLSTHSLNLTSTPNISYLTPIEVPKDAHSLNSPSTPMEVPEIGNTQYRTPAVVPEIESSQYVTPMEVPNIRSTPNLTPMMILEILSTPEDVQIDFSDIYTPTPIEVPKIESTPENKDLSTHSQNPPSTPNITPIKVPKIESTQEDKELSTHSEGLPSTPIEVPKISTPEDKDLGTHCQNQPSTPNIITIEVPKIESIPENKDLSTHSQDSLSTPIEVPVSKISTLENKDLSTHSQNQPSTPIKVPKISSQEDKELSTHSQDSPSTPIEVPVSKISTLENKDLSTHSQNQPSTPIKVPKISSQEDKELSTHSQDSPSTPIEVPVSKISRPENKDLSTHSQNQPSTLNITPIKVPKIESTQEDKELNTYSQGSPSTPIEVPKISTPENKDLSTHSQYSQSTPTQIEVPVPELASTPEDDWISYITQIQMKLNPPSKMSGYDDRSGPGPIPPRWLHCPRKSNHLVGGKFLAFKTPLSSKFDDQVAPEFRFSPQMLFASMKSYKVKIGLWIDLTNTDRFYDKDDIEQEGARYVKVKCRGHGEPPDSSQVNIFTTICDKFISSNPLEIIGVHCTHGFNRSGFMIASYFINKGDMSVDLAISEFSKARTPGIYKGDYLRILYERAGDDPDEAPPAPPLPDWCHEDDSDFPSPRGRKRERQKKNPTFMEGISGVTPVTQQPKLGTLQKRIQQMCGWKSTGFPGCQPVSMDMQNVALLRDKPYKVSWKADGTRYMMLIAGRREIYFADRDHCIFQAPEVEFRQKHDLMVHLSDTLVDGEMVIDVDPQSGAKYPRYLIYDALRVQGKDVINDTFHMRFERINTDIISPRNAAINKGLLNKKKEPFSVRRKDFWDANVMTTEKLLSPAFQAKLSHEPDGLIFQPEMDAYTVGKCDQVLKWKPASHNSVDFKLVIVKQKGEGMLQKSIGQLFVGSLDTPFAMMKVNKALKEYNNKIIECKFDGKDWIFMRERTDKSFPNSFTTAQAVCHSIQNPVTQEFLLKFMYTHGFKKPDRDLMPPPPPKRQKVE